MASQSSVERCAMNSRIAHLCSSVIWGGESGGAIESATSVKLPRERGPEIKDRPLLLLSDLGGGGGGAEI